MGFITNQLQLYTKYSFGNLCKALTISTLTLDIMIFKCTSLDPWTEFYVFYFIYNNASKHKRVQTQ